ncbi:SpoIIE family protein phosphatase [Kitasatospora sp. NPDC101176]|uniref:SpoIIE family protein phosphatase n=1 Tax=Kitasatospora sp. NPDC101176 TaxID=3364099 RepID=UPI0038217B63
MTAPTPPIPTHIVDEAPCGILVASPEAGGTVVYGNRELQAVLGARLPAAPGALARAAGFLQDRNGEPLTFVDSPLGRSLSRGIPASGVVRYGPGGTDARWLEVTCRPLEQGPGRRTGLVIAHVHDVTALRLAESTLERVRRQLEERLGDITQVHAMSKRLTGAMTLGETLDGVLREGARLLGAAKGIARSVDPVTGRSRDEATHGLSADQVATLRSIGPRTLFSHDLGPEDEALVVEDVATDPLCSPRLRELGRRLGFSSLYRVPLTSTRGAQIGTLAWASGRPGRPTARQRGLMETYCRFAGQVAESNLLYERERTIATTLQRSILPRSLPAVPGVSFAARCVPGTRDMQAGGDWYDVMPLRDGLVGIGVGDVMGKGLAAAAAMGQLSTALRSYALLHGDRPATVLADLNSLAQHADVTDIATVLYLALDPARRQVKAASAGHVPPLLVDADGARFLTVDQGPPLGVTGQWDGSETVLELAAGSTLVLCTDGLVERRTEDLSVGLERLRRAGEEGPAGAEALCDHLLTACLPGSGAAEGDDVALVVVRVD